jgi:hypothetical protein
VSLIELLARDVNEDVATELTRWQCSEKTAEVVRSAAERVLLKSGRGTRQLCRG